MTWAPASGPARYKLAASNAPAGPAVADSGLNALATPSRGAAGEGSLHPSNPLVIFGALAALTFGLMAFSTSGSVRIGHTTATLTGSVGKK